MSLSYKCIMLQRLYKNKVDDSDETYPSMKKSILLTVCGLAAIIIGSNFVVDSASTLAKMFGVSERMISLTIVAFGTSLPELVTSISATKKGQYDIAIGNVVGSNIFNIGIVIGLPILLFGGISSYVDNNNMFSGFSYSNQNDDSKDFGDGLNEGYTDLLTKRYFGNVEVCESDYDFEILIASFIEEIVEKDVMEKLYLTADFQGLMGILKR